MPKGKKVIGYPVQVRHGRGVPQEEPWDKRLNPDCWSFLVGENPVTGEVKRDLQVTLENTRRRYGDPTGPITAIVPTEGLSEELGFKGKCPGCASEIESNRALLFCPHCSSPASLSSDFPPTNLSLGHCARVRGANKRARHTGDYPQRRSAE